MLKKRWSCFFLSALLIIIGCAPRVAPPPLYRGLDLTLEEVLTRASGDIRTVRAVVDVRVERERRYHSSLSASLLVGTPGLVHMRVYRFGVLLDEVLINGHKMRLLSGEERAWLMEMGFEFYNTVFWWDGMKDAVLGREGEEYVLKRENKEVRLDGETLFPVRQTIRSDGRHAEILYRRPRRSGDYWFPSEIRIHMEGYSFFVTVQKYLVNPEPGEMDFRLSG